MTTPGYPIEFLRDDFTSLDSRKWAIAGGGSATATAGQLTLDGSAGGITLQSAITDYDFVSSYVLVQLISAPASGTSSTPLAVSSSGGDFLWKAGGSWVRAQKSDGSYGSIAEIDPPFYLRIREQAGTVFWDYSSDGATWTNAASEVLSSTPGQTYVSLDAGVGASFILSNFNILS